MQLETLIGILVSLALPPLFYVGLMEEDKRLKTGETRSRALADLLLPIGALILVVAISGSMLSAGDERGYAMLALLPLTFALNALAPSIRLLARGPAAPASSVAEALYNRVGRTLLHALLGLAAGLISIVICILIAELVFNIPILTTA